MGTESTSEPIATVVIAVRNAVSTLGEQLEALAAQRHAARWDVVVADNGSTDGSRDVAASFADRLDLVVVDATSASGPGATRNFGARVARGTFLLFADADDVVSPGWIDAYLKQGFDFATGPMPRFVDGSRPFEPRRGVAEAPPTLLTFLPYAAGANLAIHRRLFESIGGFREQYQAGEDVDLSWRLQLAGHELAFVHDAIVAKRDHRSARAVLRQYLAYGRFDVALYRDFREWGAPSPCLRSVARSYGGLVARLPTIVRHQHRARWLQQLGRRLGRLEGSARYRTWFP